MITSGFYLNVEENGFDVYVLFPEWMGEPSKEKLDTIADQVEVVVNEEYTTETIVKQKLDKKFAFEDYWFVVKYA